MTGSEADRRSGVGRAGRSAPPSSRWGSSTASGTPTASSSSRCCRSFGWSRSLLAGAFSIFTLVHGLLGLPLGWLADRVGPRRLVLPGGALLAVGLLLDGAVARPWHLYLAFGVLTAVGVATASWVPAVVLVQRWFPEHVGTALGLTSAGIGVGIFVVVPGCQWLIDIVGWRWAFRTVAVVTALWVIPSTLLLVRDPPVPPAPQPAGPAPPGNGVTLARALRVLPFWLIATAQTCTSFTNLGSSVGPWVAGRVFGATGSYWPAFGAAALSGALAATALWMARVRQRLAARYP